MDQADLPGPEIPPEPQPVSASTCISFYDSADRAQLQSPEELKEEERKIRRLRTVIYLVTQVIAQDQTLTVEQASEMVADTRRVALTLFPDKELAFNLIYWPRLQRLMRERYRMQ